MTSPAGLAMTAVASSATATKAPPMPSERALGPYRPPLATAAGRATLRPPGTSEKRGGRDRQRPEGGAMMITRLSVGLASVVIALLAAAGTPAAAGPRTLVVDDDRQQCPN